MNKPKIQTLLNCYSVYQKYDTKYYHCFSRNIYYQQKVDELLASNGLWPIIFHLSEAEIFIKLFSNTNDMLGI